MGYYVLILCNLQLVIFLFTLEEEKAVDVRYIHRSYKEGRWNISNAIEIYVFLSPETKDAGLISRSFLLSGLLFWSIA